jgi:hypothetical protein
MIRRLALLVVAVTLTILGTAGMALASTSAPARPAATPITQCSQLQFLGPQAVAACNLGPPANSAISGLLHDLNPANLVNGANNTCQPGVPMPESAADSTLLAPSPVPAAQRTLWTSYGTSGLFWAPYNLQCSEWEDLLGNSWANGLFTTAKVITSVTLTVVHAATTPNLLRGIQGTIDKAIVAVGNVARQWMVVIILLGGAYMAWALLRHRSREVLTSVLHMVIFAVPLLLLIAMPQLWTGIPAWVVNTSTSVTSDIFSTMPKVGASTSCLAVQPGDPQSAGEGATAADHGQDALWGFMACRPWLAGEFSDPALQTSYGRALLWSQSFAAGEPQTTATASLKAQLYGGIDNEINKNDPGSVDLFEGNLYQQRMMIATLAIVMDLVLAVLFIGLACTLLFAQVGFFLLMVAAPVFLLVGMYPGTAGRVFCLRWYERMLGLLVKMAVATVLLTGMLWVFGLLVGLSSSWLIQGLLIVGAGVTLIVKRKKIITGAVTAKGSMAAKVTGTPAAAQPAHATAPKRAVAGAGVLGAAAGYEAARHHASRPPEQSAFHKTVKAGQQVAAAYSTGGLSAAGASASGLAHGQVQKRRDAKRASAEQMQADAAAKEQQWRDALPGKVHQQAASEQLRGNFPNGKAAPVQWENPDSARHRRRAQEQLDGQFPEWKTAPPPEEHHENGNGSHQDREEA